MSAILTPTLLVRAYERADQDHFASTWRGMNEIPILQGLPILDLREVIALSVHMDRARSRSNQPKQLQELVQQSLRHFKRPFFTPGERRLKKENGEYWAQWRCLNPYALEATGNGAARTRVKSLPLSITNAIYKAAAIPRRTYARAEDIAQLKETLPPEAFAKLSRLPPLGQPLTIGEQQYSAQDMQYVDAVCAAVNRQLTN